MFPSNFKPQGEFNLLRIGGDNDGGYLVESASIEKTEALISMGIGKNWKFEEDFISNKAIEIHAYDHTVRGAFWPKFFIKRFLSVLIGRFSAPYNAVTTYKNFLSFFKDRAVLFFEKIGSQEDGTTNLKKTIKRIKDQPIFLKIDIEGKEESCLLGAKKQLKEVILSNVPSIVYVSCNLNTFARDAKFLLENGYRLEWLKPIDQFPNTMHLEIVSKFIEKK